MKRFRRLLDRLLFRDRGIIPTKKLLYLFLALSGALFLISFLFFSWILLGLAIVAVLGLTLFDLFYSPNRKDLEVHRDVPDELERFETELITITLENKSIFPCYVRIEDDLPQSFQASYPTRFLLQPGKGELEYSVKPSVRGKYHPNKIYIRYHSQLGLWEKQITMPYEQEIKVIPNLSETKRYLESAQSFLLHEGIKTRRLKSGQGEFANIRNYVVGDDPRKINWRQSAKLQEVMTNNDEPEHGKYVTILIDCGRLMGAELKSGNRLERTIEAAITLAACALDNGDHVSVVAFAKDIEMTIPAGKGLDHLNTILRGIYDLEVQASESNYAMAFQHAQRIQTRRSMMILFTDVYSLTHESHSFYFLKQLRRKHLVLLTGIEDELLHRTIEQEPTTIYRAMQKSTAQEQYLAFNRMKLVWSRQGITLIESKEDKLAVSTISHYIDALNRGLIG
ncbi:uncharacterized protein (DUF58 family) [Gracilibacillus halotolerans]|uniref:Uncharacterized protein (DUF58 family) n=1 Tax=Gracilibacillus halotolerans TaxID=74386 RepID=A0A841RRF9_9BACI|nr:DUF58 domain-containing protein [Gracilibacillus halotolerans]MBB6513178.1 uncharacterized protein (DUF58 family) [Gracilibacillus halotolerans]